jgi:hypothetical protein
VTIFYTKKQKVFGIFVNIVYLVRMNFSLKNNGSWDKEILADILMNSVLALTLAIAIYKQEWIWVVGCIFGLFILLIPLMLHRYRNDLIPWPVDVLVATICLLNMFGVLLRGYYEIPFYSEFTQLMVSILVAFLAFAVVYILDRYWDGLNMNTSAMVYVVVVTTMAAMMIFEAIKYIGVFGMRSTSVEMMLLSMFVGTGGGVIMGLFCLWLVNKGKFGPLFQVMGEKLNEKVISEDRAIRKKISYKDKNDKK